MQSNKKKYINIEKNIINYYKLKNLFLMVEIVENMIISNIIKFSHQQN